MYVKANKIREVGQWSLRFSAVITKSPSTRKAQSETGGYIKYIRKHDNCLFIVLEQRFLNIETAPCSQIQDATIIGLQYSKTSMLYA